MEFTVGNAFSQGWRVMKDHYGALLGAAWVYILISAAMGFIPILGSLAQLIVTGPLVAGWGYMGVKAYRGHTEFGDLWSGFKKFGEMLGIYWLLVLVYLGTLIPAAIAVGVAFAVDRDFKGPGIVIVIAGGVGSLILIFLFMARFSLALLIGMDTDSGITESMRKSWELTRPHLGTLIGLFLCMGLVSLGLTILLYLPLIFIGMPWLVCVMGAAYIMITGERDKEELERIYE